MKDHRQAVQWVFDQLTGETIEAVGHRVVHGGESFTESVRINPEIFLELERLTELAPCTIQLVWRASVALKSM